MAAYTTGAARIWIGRRRRAQGDLPDSGDLHTMGKLRQIILPVEDVGAAVAHYRDALGLELRFEDGDRWAVLDAGELALALAGPGEHPSGTVPALGVKVADVDAALRELVDGGATVLESPRDAAHERRAACRDRFGTVLALYAPRGELE
jgi:predicted enzyme related to lactoylglutathione lyase